MEKKTFKIVGSYNLRKAFVEDNGFKLHSKETLNFDALTVKNSIYLLEGVYRPYVCDITYTLPQDWDAAVKAVKEALEPDTITLYDGDYIFDMTHNEIVGRLNKQKEIKKSKYFRKATTEEIKEYLIKEAIERGFNEENSGKITFDCAGSTRKDCDFEFNKKWEYFPEEDMLSMYCNQYFYKQGNWATPKPIEQYKSIYFDGLEVKCYKGYAETTYGKITKEQLEPYFNLPKLFNFNVEIAVIRIGCKTSSNLKAIYDAIS